MAELSASAKYRLSPQDRSCAQMEYEFMHYKNEQQAVMTDGELSRLLHDAKGQAADWLAGVEFSGSKLETVIKAMDLRPLGFDMKIPFFVVQGRDDHITSFDAAKAYVEEVLAPAKGFIPIDGGHFACFTNAGGFIAALDSEVRRFAM